MTVLLILVMFLAFVGLDLLVREGSRRLRAKRELEARKAVLESSIRLDFTHEAKSLKRVEVPSPKARILAVDDEAVVLDSFRRILVLEGYAVDTVETGQEALGLVQRRDYDFVFTDLKMPTMDGVDVVKGVKHLRPDVDVAVITGYGTIETAVATMKHGAVDFVQKPFTADELAEFARKLLIRRQARLESQRAPTIKVVAWSLADVNVSNEFSVVGGAFVAPEHTWVRIESDGQVRIGLDDLVRKALGPIAQVELPRRGAQLRRGEPLVTLKRGADVVRLVAPLSGQVLQVNGILAEEPAHLCQSPYNRGWICMLQPTALAEELKTLRIGQPVVPWYQEEVVRLRTLDGPAGKGLLPVEWAAFQREFLTPRPGATPAPTRTQATPIPAAAEASVS